MAFGDNVKLLVVGDGPGRPGLEELAGSLGLADRVRFTGLVGRDEVAANVACFDIALQPSVTPYASPLKIFEYMAMGRAIVAPRTPNIEEVLVDGESARLFDVDVAGAQRDAIRELCVDDALRQRVAHGALAEIDRQQLTWDDNARRIEALTRDVAGDSA